MGSLLCILQKSLHFMILLNKMQLIRQHSEVVMQNNLYHGMTETELDEAYNNTAIVKDFDGLLKKLQARSRALYKKYHWIRDRSYGRKPRQRYDFLSSGIKNSPTYIFIHGGYWTNCNKEDFAFIAQGPHANGMNVILAEYTLAPDATMTEIVNEIGHLIKKIKDDQDFLGVRDSPLYLAGHSAGGHLASLYRSHHAISRVHMISALVDLNPISMCWLQDKLKLTPVEIKLYSPLFHLEKGAPTLVSVGGDELPELIRQSSCYADELVRIDKSVKMFTLPMATHFTILDDLANPDGFLMKQFMTLKKPGTLKIY